MKRENMHVQIKNLLEEFDKNTLDMEIQTTMTLAAKTFSSAVEAAAPAVEKHA